MILGIGVDIAEIDRFERFKQYSKVRLLEVFTEQELVECNQQYPQGSLANINEFYASRFAAKEAFYKALSNALVKLKITSSTFSFAFARVYVEVVRTTWDLPALKVNWGEFEKKIGKNLPKIEAHLSLSHEKNQAIAVVLLNRL